MAIGIYINSHRSSGIIPPPAPITGPLTLEEGLEDMMARLKRGGEVTTSGYCTGLVNRQNLADDNSPYEMILYNAPSALYDFISGAARWFDQDGLELGSDEHESFIRLQLLKALKITLNDAQSVKATSMPREDFLIAVVVAVENDSDTELFD